MKQFLKAAVAVATLAILVACNSQKGPAEAAIKAAEQAVGSVKAEAERWVPEQAKAAEDALAKAKEQFGKGDFQGALTLANDASAKARDLGAAALARKADLTKSWDEVSASVPKMVEAVKSRIEMLGKSKKLPKGIDKASFEQAKVGLASAAGSWDEAQKAFGSGDIAGAIEKANAVKAKGAEVMALLGMTTGAPAAK